MRQLHLPSTFRCSVHIKEKFRVILLTSSRIDNLSPGRQNRKLACPVSKTNSKTGRLPLNRLLSKTTIWRVNTTSRVQVRCLSNADVISTSCPLNYICCKCCSGNSWLLVTDGGAGRGSLHTVPTINVHQPRCAQKITNVPHHGVVRVFTKILTLSVARRK